jgi:hypothetical protein
MVISRKEREREGVVDGKRKRDKVRYRDLVVFQ